jgi:hypothetical protein
MVIDYKSGQKSTPGTGEALQPIDVHETRFGFPLKMNNQTINLIKDAWQPKQFLRNYWCVVLESGQALVIYKDILENKWYRQEYS